MTKEDLIAKGLTEEQADEVMKMLDGDFVTKARFNDLNKKYKEAVAKASGQTDAAAAEQAESMSALQKTIDELKTASKTAEQKHAEELCRIRLEGAVDIALMGAKVKNAKAVKALLNMDNVKLGDDGKLTGLDEQLDALRKSDEYLFATEQTLPQLSGMKPAQVGAAAQDKAPADMSYDELCAYLAQNPDAKL